ncbi:rhomboid family protein [Sinobacterium caligoides]|uniref:Rhomboid family protein n=1 Tax=Sinobacterium caligoides TaxID=933926 RepID=A0A3N2DZA2_9GAMM|nr:rhomboid family intramembrane serine protease [Sinobacterium caligoides]ROS05193.1 rhomboid family protein [Sinobacterium caligoides]
MLIIPAEKRLDWQHPPVVLLIIIAINFIVFFGLQSDDNKYYQAAFDLYLEHDLQTIESPIYEQYLRLERPDHWQQIQPYQQVDKEQLVAEMIFDRRFYDFSIKQGDHIFARSALLQWQEVRPEVNALIDQAFSSRFHLAPSDINIVSLISHQFLHADLSHLLGNMVLLLLLGFAVEASLGHGRFLLFYLLSGLGGGLFFAFFERWSGSDNNGLIGASGAISGVMAIYVSMYRLQKIEFFYWFFIFVGYFRAPALVILPLYIGNEVYSLLTTDNHVAYTAHIGGFISGAALIWLTFLRQPDALDEDYLQAEQPQAPYAIALDKLYCYIADFQFSRAENYAAELLTQYNHIELKQIYYQLLKTAPSEKRLPIALQIICEKNQHHAVIKQQLQVWLHDKSALQEHIDQHSLILFAIRLVDIEETTTAEKLLAEQLNTGNQDPMLAKLARKLSNHYRQLQHPKKQQYFDSIATSLL